MKRLPHLCVSISLFTLPNITSKPTTPLLASSSPLPYSYKTGHSPSMEPLSNNIHSLSMPSTYSSPNHKMIHSFWLQFLDFTVFLAFVMFSTKLALKMLLQLCNSSSLNHVFLFWITCLILLFFAIIKRYFFSNSSSVYLVDFSCLKPPSYCRVPFSTFLENASKFRSFDSESMAFMSKILYSSGQSEETFLPPALHYIPPKTRHQESIKEVHVVLFTAMDDLLAKTSLSPTDIDVLIVNCSGFCPSPSLSSIVVNKYAMRTDVKSFNLSGMGCSASTLGLDLAQNILKIHENSNAVILSTEILSEGWYSGHEKPKLLLNCLFRMGSAAILLTNKKEAKKFSKYEVVKTLRTQRAFEDKAYLSAIREEDSNGKLGVTLRRDLLQVAGETLRSNVAVLGSSILPLKEKFGYGVSVLRRRFLDKPCEIYVPDFKTVIEHFCLPTSGGPVIREIGKGLRLGEREMEPALMTLHRFGNQSSSSLWYELAYLEAKERVKKGDRVWQLGMGSGPKCNSVVLRCLRPIVGESSKGPWADCVHRYPVRH